MDVEWDDLFSYIIADSFILPIAIVETVMFCLQCKVSPFSFLVVYVLTPAALTFWAEYVYFFFKIQEV